MREYTVKIKETLEEYVTVEASSAQEAKDKVEAGWKDGDYILDAEHFQCVTFAVM